METLFKHPNPRLDMFANDKEQPAAEIATIRFVPLPYILLAVFLMATLATTDDKLAGAAPQANAGQAEVTAISGEPFGVARIRYPVVAQPAAQRFAQPVATILGPRITSPQQQIYYPAFADITARVDERAAVANQNQRRIGRGRLLGRIADMVREATGEAEEALVGREVWFLFQGDQPFTVMIDDGQAIRTTVIPQTSTQAAATPRNLSPQPRPSDVETVRTAMLQRWWQSFAADAANRMETGDYSPLIENYLVGMLARRFGLVIPQDLIAKPDPEKTSILAVLQQVAGAEAMRNRTLGRVAQGDTERFAKADLPVPSEPVWINSPIADIGDDVTLEGLASRVPLDSLYIRFGSFKNYLWFRDLGNRHGGDITRMVKLRGFDYQATKRIETQLNVQATELSLMLGSSIVEDMAIVGHDLFLTEGASMGVLLEAKNAFLLGTSLRNDRATMAKQVPDASLEDVTISGRTVSLLSTPDNRIRSYLVFDGQYALVSNSKTLVEKFLATGNGGVSLADSDAFRYARMLMRVENDYKIFAYFSDEFFQNLVGPAYQIELRRRLYATADIELIQLARLAAQSEGRELTELDELIEGGYLPDGMGQRPDGSGPILASDQVLNSRRGKRGYFTPISDVTIDGVTDEESQWYQRQANFYVDNWREMDPLVAGIRTIDSPNEGYQRLEIHAEVVPLVPEKYGWIAEQLGPPTTETIRFGPDDIAAIQAYVVSDQLGGTIPPHHLFGGIKDAMLPNPAELDGLFDQYRALKSLAGYIGAWPDPGLLDRLPLGLGRGRPVGPGMSKLLVGLYRYQGNGFSLISFMPEIITATLPNLSVEEAVEPAQVRFHVDRLEGTRIESWVNQQLYERNLKTSLAGARLLNSLTSQLNVRPTAVKEMAEQLFDARLQCPLGGEYVLQSEASAAEQNSLPGGQREVSGNRTGGFDETWVSTAWDTSAGQSGAAGANYQSPLLSWFRGASGRLTQYDSRLVADLILDMQNGL